jgi:predicted nucleic acid-binding protein
MPFIDANIFVRYLTGDDPAKAKRCLALFQRIKQNEVTVTTSEAVIAEVVYVLSSKIYGLSRSDIAVRLRPLLILPNLKFLYRSVFLRALELYVRHNVDFEDCLTAAYMERQKITDIYSYDKDFDTIAGIKRLEP